MKAQEKYAWCISTCPRLFNRSNLNISKLITKHFLLMDTELQSANNTITINEKLSHRHDEKKIHYLHKVWLYYSEIIPRILHFVFVTIKWIHF